MAAGKGGSGRACGACGAWGWVWALGLSLGLGWGRAERVPLLGWSTDSSLWPPQIQEGLGGGQVVGEGQLQALLSPALTRGPRTLLLVLMDQLSLEDFTAFGGGPKPGGVFSSLQGALAMAGSSLVIPGVSGGLGGALPHTLAQALGAAPLRVGGGDPLSQLSLNETLGTLLLLRLPQTHSSGLLSPREVLSRNDEELGRVLRALREEAVPHTTLLTALRPSRPPHSAAPPPLPPLGRSLLGAEEEEEEPPGFGEGASDLAGPPPLRWPPQGPPQILFWARSLWVGYRGEERDLGALTFGEGAKVRTGGSSWDPQEARLVLSYDDVFGGTLNITLVLRCRWFGVSGRPWSWVSEVGVSLEGGRDPPALFSGSPWGGAAAPTPLGWRCGVLEAPGPFLTPPNPPGSTQNWRVRMEELQVQAFNVSGGVFGGASDCASFFTPPLWMGLLTGGGLLGGLFWGGGLLLHLRTMDRFDDPRGPLLNVPLGD